MRIALLLTVLAAVSAGPAPTQAQSRAQAQVQPEPRASLLQRAPKLATTGPLKPLAAPLAIGGTGWGPFKRLCVTRMLIDDKGREVPETEPSCFTVEQAKDEAGTWHLAVRTDPIRGGPRVAFQATRDAEGRVGPIAVTPPEGMATPPGMLEKLQTLFRIMLQAHGRERTTLTPKNGFVLPLQAALADPDTTVEGGGLACLPDGTASLHGRPVLVATCRATARTSLGDGAVSRIDIAGRFAIDTATGLVLQYGYASFLFMEADPKKTMPNLRWRGVSRQSLQ